MRDAILKGRAQPGSLLPSTRSLAEQLGIHRHTVLRALEELQADGWVKSEPGRGYRVTAQHHESLAVVARSWSQIPSLPEPISPTTGDYDFHSCRPDLREFPKEEFLRCLRDALREEEATRLLSYSSSVGADSFRSCLQDYLRRVRGFARGQIVVTQGSQEAIFLLALLLLRGERKIAAVEQVGYHAAWEAFNLAGAEVVGLPVDSEGLCVDSLEKLAERCPPALLYITPLHQYPTTVTMSTERRNRLLEVVQRYQIPVIEDDYDHEFHYLGKPALPLAVEDRSGLVLYVSTFSKLVYPSARLGFAVVPDALFEPLRRIKHWSSRQSPVLIQEAMARWMRTGGFDRHLRKMRKLYRQRMDVMTAELSKMGLSFVKPTGGMSVWVDTGHDSLDVVRKTAEMGLELRSEHDYWLESPKGARLPHLRLGFAGTTEGESARKLAILERSLAALS